MKTLLTLSSECRPDMHPVLFVLPTAENAKAVWTMLNTFVPNHTYSAPDYDLMQVELQNWIDYGKVNYNLATVYHSAKTLGQMLRTTFAHDDLDLFLFTVKQLNSRPAYGNIIEVYHDAVVDCYGNAIHKWLDEPLFIYKNYKLAEPKQYNTVILFQTALEVQRYNAVFGEYLHNTLVTTEGNFTEVYSPERLIIGLNHKRAFDRKGVRLLDLTVKAGCSIESGQRVGSHEHAKGFITVNRISYDEDDVPALANLQDILAFVPVGYLIKNEVSFRDTQGNAIETDYLAFSYSAGYYDPEEREIYRNQIVDIEDMVTLETSGNRIPMDDAYLIGGCWYDDDEVVRDEETDEFILRREARYIDNYGWFSIHSDVILHCDACGSLHHEDDSHYGDGETLCSDCYEGIVESGLYRYGYSTDVLDYTKMLTPHVKINGQGVYTGIELECYCDEHEELNPITRKHMNKHPNDVCYVPTEDGSLHDYHGVEFIFKPMSISDMDNEITRFVGEEGYHLSKHQRDGYGLHIHVSNHFLTQLDKIRIQNFVNAHEGFCRNIGGREETEYQRAKESCIKKKELGRDRYSMVNALPARTIEFRFPVSLVDRNHIMSNIQLCMAMVMYVKFHCSSVRERELESFMLYILDNYKVYPDLIRYCDQDLITSHRLYQHSLASKARLTKFQAV